MKEQAILGFPNGLFLFSKCNSSLLRLLLTASRQRSTARYKVPMKTLEKRECLAGFIELSICYVFHGAEASLNGTLSLAERTSCHSNKQQIRNVRLNCPLQIQKNEV